MLWKKKNKPEKAVKLAADTGRRGFLKFLGLSGLMAPAALAKPLQIPETTKIFIEEAVEAEKLSGTELAVPESAAELPALFNEDVPQYLIQDGTGRLYPWSKQLGKRKDMSPLAPELCNRIHADIKVVQNFEQNFKDNLKRSLTNQVKREIEGPEKTRAALDREYDPDRIFEEAEPSLPMTHQGGRVKWVKASDTVEGADLMKKPTQYTREDAQKRRESYES